MAPPGAWLSGKLSPMIPDAHVPFDPGLGNGDLPYPALDGPQTIALMDRAGIGGPRIFARVRVISMFYVEAGSLRFPG